MPRPEKVEAVATIKERLERAQAVFLTEYAGLSVQEQQALRRGLRGSDAEYKVVKMSLTRLAAAELGLDIGDMLTGPTALAFADGDAVTAAKVLQDFAGDHEKLLIKGALMAGEVLTPEKVSQLAEIEPREVLLAKLAGGFQAPMSRFAGLMAALLRGSATVFQHLLEKKEADQPAPDEPELVDEPESGAAADAPEGASNVTTPAEADPEDAAPASAEPGDEEQPAAEAADEPAAEAAEDDTAAEGTAEEDDNGEDDD